MSYWEGISNAISIVQRSLELKRIMKNTLDAVMGMNAPLLVLLPSMPLRGMSTLEYFFEGLYN
jgi:hypothetical protein